MRRRADQRTAPTPARKAVSVVTAFAFLAQGVAPAFAQDRFFYRHNNGATGVNQGGTVDITPTLPPGPQPNFPNPPGQPLEPVDATFALGSPSTMNLSQDGQPLSCSGTGLPPGVSPHGNALSGTPSKLGTYTASLNCSYGGAYGARQVKIRVATDAVLAMAVPSEGDATEAFSGSASLVGARFGQVRFSMAAGAMPAGLSLNEFTGAVSGAPTDPNGASAQNLRVAATDEGGNVFTSPTFGLTVHGVLRLSAAAATEVREGDAVSLGLGPAGGKAPLSVSATNLPPGLALNASTGAVTGIASTAGRYATTYTVTDSRGRAASRSVDFTVKAPAVQVVWPAVPPLTVGRSFEFQMLTQNGVAATWAKGASAPEWLSVSPGGLVQGTPPSEGPAQIQLAATNASGDTTTVSRSYVARGAVVAATYPASTTILAATPGTIPATTPASGGSGTLVYSLDQSVPGVSATSQGAIQYGSLAAGSDPSVRVVATDSEGRSATSEPSVLVVKPKPTFDYDGVLATVSAPFRAVATPTGVGSNLKYELTAGTLPTGLTLAQATGLVTGTPTAIQDSPVTVKLTDLDTGFSGSKDFVFKVLSVEGVATTFPSVTFNGTPANVSIFYDAVDALPSALPYSGGSFVIGMSFDRPRRVDGYVAPATTHVLQYMNASGVWTTAASGSNAAGKAFTATTAQHWQYSISSSSVGVGTLKLTTGNAAPTAPSVAAQSQVFVDKGKSSTFTPVASNAPGPVWALASGTIPPGMSLDTATGVVSGVPTTVGNYDFALTVTTSAGIRSVARPFSVFVNSDVLASSKFPVSATGATLASIYDADANTKAASGEILIDFGEPVHATAFDLSSPFTVNILYADHTGGWSLAAGSVASGNNFSRGITAQRWRVERGNADVISTFRIRSAAAAPVAPRVSIPSDPSLTVNAAATFAPTAADVQGATSWSLVSGALPTGMTLNASTGAVSGTPTVIGTYVFSLRVTDPRGVPSEPKQGTITVNTDLLASLRFPVSVTGATVAAIYDAESTTKSTSASMELDFGVPVQATGFVVGGLSYYNQGGVSYMDEGGVWRTAASNIYADTTFAKPITAQRWRTTEGYPAIHTFRLVHGNVAPLAPSVSAAEETPVTRGKSESVTPTAKNASGATTWTYSGDLPPGMQFNASTGVVSGVPTTVGLYAYDLRVTDPRGVVSEPKTVKVSVNTDVLASARFPVSATGATVAAMYDNDSNTKTTQAVVEFDFGEPVQATGYELTTLGYYYQAIVQYMEGGSWKSAASGVYTNGTFAKPVTAQRWRVSEPNGSTSAFRLAHDGVAPVAPRLTVTAETYMVSGTQASVAAASYNTSGTRTWTRTGEIPPGMDLHPETGLLSGTPTQVGTFTYVLRVTDPRGVTSEPQTAKVVVNTDATADRFPVSVSSGSVAAMYDTDNATTATASSAAPLVLDFGQPVRAATVYAYATGAGTLRYQYERGPEDWQPLLTGDSQYVSGSFNPVTAQRFRVYPTSGTSTIYKTYVATSSAPTAPKVNTPGDATWVRNGNYTHTPTASNASGAVTWSYTGDIPTGMTFVPATGVVSGMPTTVGTYAYDLSVVDPRGVAAVPKKVTIKVQTDATADRFPAISGGLGYSGGGAPATLASIYDADDTTAATFTKDNPIVLDFGEVVRGSYPYFYGATSSRTVRIQYEDTANPGSWLDHASGSGSSFGGSTTAVEARRWRLIADHATASATAYRFFVGTGNPPVAPHVVAAGDATWIRNAVRPAHTPSSGNSVGTRTWSYTGDIPTGMTFEPTTGAISGQPSAVGDYTYRLSVVDGRGVQAEPKSVTIKVQTEVTADRFPTVSGGLVSNGGGTPATLASIYDDDANTSSTATKANPVVLDFGEIVRGSYIYFQGSLGGRYAIVEYEDPKAPGTWVEWVSSTSEAFGLSRAAVEARRYRLTTNHATAGITAQRFNVGTSNPPVAPSVNPPSGATWVRNVNYTHAPSASNATAPRTWSYTGDIPTGMTFEPTTGAISGQPSAVGDYTYRLSVVDGRGVQAEPKSVTIKVQTEVTADRFPTVSGGLLSNGGGASATLASIYDDDTNTSSSATKANPIVLDFGEVVRGSYVYFQGTLGGRYAIVEYEDPKVPGTWVEWVSSTSEAFGLSRSPIEARRYRLTTNHATAGITAQRFYVATGNPPVAPSVNPPSGMTWIRNVNYAAHAPSASNATAPRTWSYAGDIPTGMTFEPTTGAISGQPTAVGEYTYRLRVLDGRGVQAEPKSVTIKVQTEVTADRFPAVSGGLLSNGGGAPATLASIYDDDTQSSASATKANPIVLDFGEVVRGSYVYFQGNLGGRYAVVEYEDSRNPGTWVEWVSSTSEAFGLSRSPVEARRYRLTTNHATAGITAYRFLVGTGNPPTAPHVNSAGNRTLIKGTNYVAQNPSITNAVGPNAWTVSGDVPTGMSFEPTTGAISGTPTVAGTFVYQIRATDSRGILTEQKATQIVVQTDKTANYLPTVTGGTAGASTASMYDADSGSGASYNQANPIVFDFGEPVRANQVHYTGSNYGNYVAFQYEDAGGVWQSLASGNSATTYTSSVNVEARRFRLYFLHATDNAYVNRAYVSFSSPPVAPWISSVANRTTLTRNTVTSSTPTASDLSGAATWSYTGNLPTNMTFEPSTGAISGTPTAAGTYTYSLQVRDARGVTSVSKNVTITVN